MVQIFELSGTLTIINILRAIKEKQHSKTSNVSREMEKLKQNQKEVPEIKALLKQKMSLMGRSLEWTWQGKDSMNIKVDQKKCPKLKTG